MKICELRRVRVHYFVHQGHRSNGNECSVLSSAASSSTSFESTDVHGERARESDRNPRLDRRFRIVLRVSLVFRSLASGAVRALRRRSRDALSFPTRCLARHQIIQVSRDVKVRVLASLSLFEVTVRRREPHQEFIRAIKLFPNFHAGPDAIGVVVGIFHRGAHRMQALDEVEHDFNERVGAQVLPVRHGFQTLVTTPLALRALHGGVERAARARVDVKHSAGERGDHIRSKHGFPEILLEQDDAWMISRRRRRERLVQIDRDTQNVLVLPRELQGHVGPSRSQLKAHPLHGIDVDPAFRHVDPEVVS
mmetsp:Transcript_5305/g.20671  ORF Transcript_5305/g.20671 Transcript_5305/m.20671 type:complete len:308 (-) Transcript_5305:2039-2962(-)